MARINLLPWREELRKQRKQQFLTATVISIAITGAVFFWVHMYMVSMIENQEARNQFLREEIKQVEAKIKEIENIEKEKASLLSRIKVIENLQSNRPEVVHLFEEVVKAVPDGLHLTNLKQTNNSVSLEGLAQSNARVSTFMRNLDASPWFANPSLSFIETQKGEERKFALNFSQTPANTPTPSPAAGKGADKGGKS